MDMWGIGLAYASAALALMGGLVGSSIGIYKAGVAGTAALAEDPKQFRNVFILAALPMTQTFYSLIIMIQVMSYVSSHMQTLTFDKSLGILGLSLAVALAELFSAWYQGKVCASGITELPRTRGAITFSTLMLAVYVELIGILGMVFGLLGLSLMK
jgi:V/A-type H+-transporting ATPase subunit K